MLLRCNVTKSFRYIAAIRRRKFYTSLTALDAIEEDLFSQKLIQPIGDKITIVGAGQVGMACAIACLTQNVSNDICLLDMDKNKSIAEKWDLEQGSSFLNSPKITGSTDYATSACSRICIITAGVKQKQGETRLTQIQRNADLMKEIVPALVEHSPDTILLLASSPVDVMTYVAWHLSGLPTGRVIGSGTSLDTARFHHFISKRLGVSPSSIHGWVIGEHGDSSVAVWSGVTVGCVRLHDIQPNIGVDEDPEKWTEVNRQIVRASYDIHKIKGYTSWAIGLACASICSAILENTGRIEPVTTLAQHQHRIKDEIFLSLPCVLNAGGIAAIVQQNLNEHEIKLLHKSARILELEQEQVKF